MPMTHKVITPLMPHACSRFFDLSFWRVILLDQRGCGNSQPRGCLKDNTTQDLVDDLEKLREHLKIQSWLVVGGSWGVALALAYASTHAARVTGLVLRGVCLMRPQELYWMYGGMAGMMKPAAWAQFLSHLPQEEQHMPLAAYYRRLLSKDSTIQNAAARCWMSWESCVGRVDVAPELQLWAGSQQASTWQQCHHPQPADTWPHRAPPRPAPVPSSSSSSSPAHSTRLQPKPRRPAAAVRGNTVAVTQHLQPMTGTHSAHGSDASIRQAAGATHHDHHPAEYWLQQVQCLVPPAPLPTGDPNMPHSTVQALLECHYSVHAAFQLATDPLLSPWRVAALRTVPCIAIQGAADMICPPGTAWELHEVWPEMELRIVPLAGHSMYDPRITHELVAAIQTYQSWLRSMA